VNGSANTGRAWCRTSPTRTAARGYQPIPIRATAKPRALAGRRVRAARLLEGGVSIRDAASATGMSHLHLVAVERG
jgi:hypothetical protein